MKTLVMGVSYPAEIRAVYFRNKEKEFMKKCVVLYLDEEGEADPLVVLGELPVLGEVVSGMVDPGGGHVRANLPEERPGDCVGGVNPTKRIQYVFGHVSVREKTHQPESMKALS